MLLLTMRSSVLFSVIVTNLYIRGFDASWRSFPSSPSSRNSDQQPCILTFAIPWVAGLGRGFVEERPYMTRLRYHRPMPYIHCICYAKVSNWRPQHLVKDFLSSFVAGPYVERSEEFMISWITWRVASS